MLSIDELIVVSALNVENKEPLFMTEYKNLYAVLMYLKCVTQIHIFT